MGEFFAFEQRTLDSNDLRLDRDEGGFESLGAAADKVVEGLRAQLRLTDIMVSIPLSPHILAHIDHDALSSGLDRTELLRRCVTAAYMR